MAYMLLYIAVITTFLKKIRAWNQHLPNNYNFVIIVFTDIIACL